MQYIVKLYISTDSRALTYGTNIIIALLLAAMPSSDVLS